MNWSSGKSISPVTGYRIAVRTKNGKYAPSHHCTHTLHDVRKTTCTINMTELGLAPFNYKKGDVIRAVAYSESMHGESRAGIATGNVKHIGGSP